MTTLFTEADRRLFEKICRLDQGHLIPSIGNCLRSRYAKDKIKITKDYILAEGNIPIILTCHMDTVFPEPPQDIYFDNQAGVLWSPEGLGADDRAGVFLILKLIQNGYYPHLIFTTDEEKGSLGADEILRQNYNLPFPNAKYIVALDRRNNNDCVFYDCDNKDFAKYIESFGFKTAIGTFTDICVFCPEWKIAGVNLSVGYKNEHTYSEILNVRAMMLTFKRLIAMLKDVQNIENPYEYIPLPFNKYESYSYFNLSGSGKCFSCHNTFTEYELFPVTVNKNNYTVDLCPDCLTKSADWCSLCNLPFLKSTDATGSHICPVCKNKKVMVNNND